MLSVICIPFVVPRPCHLGARSVVFPALWAHMQMWISVIGPFITGQVLRCQRWRYDIKHLFFHVRSTGMSVNFTIFALIIESIS